MHQEEDETVDVESYGEETSNGAINMTSQFYNNNNNSVNNNNNNNNSNQVINNNNNNNNTIIHNKIDKTTPEEHTITSLNRPAANWDNKSRMSLSINCTQINESAITRVTPTSSDQRITDVEYEMDAERESQERMRMSDNEEEVVVDNTDDEAECGGGGMKRKQALSALQHASQQQQPPRLVNGMREIKKRFDIINDFRCGIIKNQLKKFFLRFFIVAIALRRQHHRSRSTQRRSRTTIRDHQTMRRRTLTRTSAHRKLLIRQLSQRLKCWRS